MPNNIPRPSGGQRVWVVNPETEPVPIQLVDSALFDAFGRVRVSTPFTLFDSKQLHDKEPLYFDESITNNSGSATSTHSSIEARTRMEVGNSDNITRQTFLRFNYQPGKGHLSYLTFNFLGAQAGVTKAVGLFDANNGIFLRHNGTDLQAVIRKNAVEHAVNQGNWNIDPLNGHGNSGIVLDINMVQIFYIDFEWLAAGRVRIGFVIDGVIYIAHEFLHANKIATVYMSTPNLPVRYEIDAGAAGEGAMDHICATVISEGGFEPKGKIFGVDSGALVTLATANTVYGMLAIRLRDTHLDIKSILNFFTTYSASVGVHYAHLYLNPTLAGGSWTFNNVNTTYSAMEFADGGNGVTINGGVVLQSLIIAGRDSSQVSIQNERQLGAAIDGTRDIIAVAIEPLTNNQDCAATLNWREV